MRAREFPEYLIAFQVQDTIPVPQGSMKILPTRRIVPGVPLVLHSVKELLMSVTMTSDNAKLKDWRNAVKAEAQANMAQYGVEPLLEGAVRVDVSFYFPYLKKHLKANGTLRDDVPLYKETMPDTDKLQRAIGDALTGVCYRDDAQIAVWFSRRIYAAREGVAIGVYAL